MFTIEEREHEDGGRKTLTAKIEGVYDEKLKRLQSELDEKNEQNENLTKELDELGQNMEE